MSRTTTVTDGDLLAMDPERPEAGKRVAVAFSGGLDSTAAIVLMMEQGFDVVAVTMLPPLPSDVIASTRSSVSAIAESLGVEHEFLDVADEFERHVIEPFIRRYVEGLTPNPCIACNRLLKFGMILNRAKELGCGLLATGHYARIVTGDGRDTISRSGEGVPQSDRSTGRDPSVPLKILRGADGAKDQSYVLWTLDQETLKNVSMPLGGLKKDEAERAVADTGLRPMVLPESQDICFLSGNRYTELIAERVPQAFRPGPIVDTEGSIVGEHRGLPFYTVGQRHHLGVSSRHALYVLELRPDRNTLVVGDIEHRFCSEFYVEDINIVSGEALPERLSCEVATRYRGPSLPARIRLLPDGGAVVRYAGSGPPAAPGQSAVFYLGDEMLGGGIIRRNPSSP